MQHWKCEVRLSLSLSLNTRWMILEACVNADWVYSVDSVFYIKLILSFIFHAIYGAVSRGCMYSAYSFLLWWLWEYVYFILLSSSNRKYDPFPIAYIRLRPWISGMRYMPFYVLVFFFIVVCRHNSKIALINPLSKLELSQLHTRT